MAELRSGGNGPDETPTKLSAHLQTDTFKRHLEAILPAHMGSERFVSVCLRQLSTTPKLLECSLQSVVGGMMEAATLGLEVGTMGECWLIPYGGEAQLQVGVWGFMALAWRSEAIADVQVDVSLKGERFSWQKGTDGFLHHMPAMDRDLNDTDAIEWVYAVVRTLKGGAVFDAFGPAWIERIRGRSKSPNSPAWLDFYAEMAMAKALKKVLRRCPMSRELARAVTLDDQVDANAKQVWDVDTSHLLPANVALDPKTETARKAMSEMGAKPGRTPEPAKAGPQPRPQPEKAGAQGHGLKVEEAERPEEGPKPQDEDAPTEGGDVGW